MIKTTFAVECDDCGTVAYTFEETAKAARKMLRTKRDWVSRNHPDDNRKIDLCEDCAVKPEYHRQSEMNVAEQIRKFDQKIDLYFPDSAQRQYWIYLKALFMQELSTKPRPFKDYEPMFLEEFGL